MSVLEKYEKAHSAFASGSVLTDSNEKLIEYLSGLSNQNNTNTGTQHRDLIRGITINHILLQHHIDALNRQNAKTQKWVIVLAIAALLSSIIQIFSPALFQGQSTASAQQMLERSAAIPSQEKLHLQIQPLRQSLKHENL